jgi:FemAB-related protein (PEP-CTERM system-associated)
MIIRTLTVEEIGKLLKPENFANFYQSTNWMRTIKESYKFTPFYMTLFDNEKILNAIPFFFIKSIFLGKKFVSMPYGDYGGFLFSDINADWIIKELENLARKNNVDYVEIRELDLKLEKNLKSFEKKTYVNFTLNLNKSLEDIWASFDKKVRNSIRKAEKNNVKVIEGDRKDLEEFYRLYIKTMKKLGSPPHSFEFFDNVFKFCSNNIKLLFAVCDNKKIAASIFFLHNKKIYYWKNVSEYEFLNLRPNDLILYKMIEWGQKKNYESLDLGRSRENEGGYLFKKRWGGKMSELKYYYRLFKDVEIPDPEEEKYKFLGNIWKILPIFLIKRLGPMIRKNFA